jgi:hypothetical protein
MVVAAMAGCTGGPTPAATSGAAGSPPVHAVPGGWLTFRDGDLGFSAAYPATWHRASSTLTPHLSDPREILAVASYPLRADGSRCSQYPVNAIEDLGSDDALVWLAERRPGLGYPVRRGLFLRSDLRAGDDSPGCLSKPKMFMHWVTAFADQGRAFDVYVAWGKNASTATKRSALGVLNSLQFDPAPDAPAHPRCGRLDPGGKRYRTAMLPTKAAPGDEIVLSGPTLRAEDGRYFPSDRVEIWFNTKVPTTQVPNATPIAPGPVLNLVTVDDTKRCTFSTTFTVPEVKPGQYKIADFVFFKGGYGVGIPRVLTIR